MDDLQWLKSVNKVVTGKWSQLKNTLVMKDFVDHLIQKRVVTLDYWMCLKSKSISESERTEDFLAIVMTFSTRKYLYFLEALNKIDRHDLVKDLSKAIDMTTRKPEEVDREKKVNQQGAKNSEKTKNDNDIKPKSREMARGNTERNKQPNNQPKNIQGQTDADQMPTDIVNKADGAGDTLAGAKKEIDNNVKSTTANTKQQPGKYQSMITQNLYKGIGNKKKVEPNQEETETENQTQKVTPRQKKTVELKGDEKNAGIQHQEIDEISRPSTSKSREEILEEREKMLQSKESELKKKEMELKEHEQSLIEKETKLLTRENTGLIYRTSESEEGPQSLALDIPPQQLDSNRTTASTTSSSELLAEVREQLKEMKRIKEIESEHTPYCNTPKEEYVRLQDFQNVQQHLDNLSEEMNTEREGRQNVQQKVEDLKNEIEILKDTIKHHEEEEESKDVEIKRKINKLKNELKNARMNYNEGLNRLKMDSKSKESEIVVLKQNVDTMKKSAEDLEKRVEMLENDKLRYEHNLQGYEKEVSDLRKVLEEKENELSDLRKVLANTKSEKEHLSDELAKLNSEIQKLKEDKKRLESEKKTLLGRCVKPQWNQAPSGPSRRTSFK